MSINRPRRHRLRMLVAVSALSLAGCSESESGSTLSDEDAKTFAFEQLRTGAEAAESISFAEDLSDYLPGQLVSQNGADPAPLASGIVLGDVSSVDPLGAWKVAELENGEEDPDGEEVAFTSESADWRIVSVSMTIDRSWGKGVPQAGSVRYLLSIGGTVDPEIFMRGIAQLRDSLAVLGSPGYIPDDPELLRVMEQQAALGTVVDGKITFPMIDELDEPFVKDLLTLQRLDEMAYEQQPVILVEGSTVVSR